jgi:hypothetical protein
MKKFSACLSIAACGLVGAASAETWTGTVVDVMCKDKDAASHTKECAVACSKSGYGLVTAGGKFVKFDEKGNAKALAALQGASKESDLKATVSGKMQGEVIQIDSIQIN